MRWHKSVAVLAVMVFVTTFCVACATAPSEYRDETLEFATISKGTPAPFDGYLANDATLDAIDAALIDLQECETATKPAWYEKPLAGAKGLVLGLVVGYLAGAVE